MTFNQDWTILWPKTFNKELAEKRVFRQIHHSSSKLLISNHQPKEFYFDFIREKPELCHITHLVVNIEKDLSDKGYRLSFQDKICLWAEEYSCSQTNQIHIEFISNITPKLKKDFCQYLMDILVFFQERFLNIFRNNSIFIEAPFIELKDMLDILKAIDSKQFFGLSYYPSYCEKQGFDTLKTSFLWKPWVQAVLLNDLGFDFKTEAIPGEGITPNKSACQIALENKKRITFIFKPKMLPLDNNSKIEEYLWKCENFMSTIGI